MHTHYHGDIEVEWTDREWERLQRIKRWKETQRIRGGPKNVQIGFVVPPPLKAKTEAYAKDHGVSCATLMRQVLLVLTEGA